MIMSLGFFIVEKHAKSITITIMIKSYHYYNCLLKVPYSFLLSFIKNKDPTFFLDYWKKSMACGNSDSEKKNHIPKGQ